MQSFLLVTSFSMSICIVYIMFICPGISSSCLAMCHACVYVCAYVCVYIYVCVCMYMYVYMYVQENQGASGEMRKWLMITFIIIY